MNKLIAAPREGGRVDVLAEKSDRRIAIEIETGKSDVVSNVRACLLAGLDQVLVIATNAEALEKIDRELGKAGLLIGGRVEVELAGWTGPCRDNTAQARNSATRADWIVE